MCKNHKHSYTPTINRQAESQIMNSHSQLLQENKTPKNTAKEGHERPLQGKLQTTAQGNQRGHKQTEKHSMLMIRKNQYRENGHTTQSNL